MIILQAMWGHFVQFQSLGDLGFNPKIFQAHEVTDSDLYYTLKNSVLPECGHKVVTPGGYDQNAIKQERTEHFSKLR